MFCFAQFFYGVKGYLMSPDTFSGGPFDIVNKHRNINAKILCLDFIYLPVIARFAQMFSRCHNTTIYNPQYFFNIKGLPTKKGLQAVNLQPFLRI